MLTNKKAVFLKFGIISMQWHYRKDYFETLLFFNKLFFILRTFFSSPSVKRPYFARPCTRLFSIETGLCSCPSPYVCISRTSHMQHDATHKESNQNEPNFFSIFRGFFYRHFSLFLNGFDLYVESSK